MYQIIVKDYTEYVRNLIKEMDSNKGFITMDVVVINTPSSSMDANREITRIYARKLHESWKTNS